jgi:hypothetical protein
MPEMETLVRDVARAAAQKIYGPRQQALSKATVVFHTQSEAEILIKECIHVELVKLGLVK